jgi:SPOR domain
MRRKWILIGIPCAIATGLVPVTSRAADRGLCQQIRFACLNAGFVQGGAREGNGLWRDCIDPVMQGWIPRGKRLPLPHVNPRIVAACRMNNPNFGRPEWARGGYDAPHFARPAAPAFNEGTEAKTLEKRADAAKAPEKPVDTTKAVPTPNAEPKTNPPVASSPIPGEKPVEGPSPVQMSASEPAGTPSTPYSATSSGSSGSSSSPPPPSAEAAASEEPTQTANLDPAPNIPPGTTSFGIEIGTVDKQNRLQPMWRDFLSKHSALVAGLQARRMLAPDKKWRLIAGPFGSIAEATQNCGLFKKSNLKCEVTAFTGDEL